MSDLSHVADGLTGLLREFRRIIESRTSPALNTRRREAFAVTGFQRLSQEQAMTSIDSTGHTAIRVNLPPIAFNAARVRVRMEGEDTDTALVDLEVPGIIVIDPGHGGDKDESGSNANHAVSHTSKILEKNLALDFGLRSGSALPQLRDADALNLRVYMTRTTDRYRPGKERAGVGKEKGGRRLAEHSFQRIRRPSKTSRNSRKATDRQPEL